jgi:hypothetical protein
MVQSPGWSRGITYLSVLLDVRESLFLLVFIVVVATYFFFVRSCRSRTTDRTMSLYRVLPKHPDLNPRIAARSTLAWNATLVFASMAMSAARSHRVRRITLTSSAVASTLSKVVSLESFASVARVFQIHLNMGISLMEPLASTSSRDSPVICQKSRRMTSARWRCD